MKDSNPNLRAEYTAKKLQKSKDGLKTIENDTKTANAINRFSDTSKQDAVLAELQQKLEGIMPTQIKEEYKTKLEQNKERLTTLSEKLTDIADKMTKQREAKIKEQEKNIKENELNLKRTEVLINVTGSILDRLLKAITSQLPSKPLVDIVIDVGTSTIGEIKRSVADSPHVSGWVAFFVIVYTVIFGVNTAYAYRRQPHSPKYNNGGVRGSVAKTVSLVMPGYKFRLFTEAISPYASIKKTTDRPTVVGRCNNLDFHEKPSVLGGGVCARTSLPQPLEWLVPISNMPELVNLPDNAVEAIVGLDNYRSRISIPWKTYGATPSSSAPSSIVDIAPDCAGAFFTNMPSESAAYLFTNDTKDACYRKSIDRTQENNPSI